MDSVPEAVTQVVEAGGALVPRLLAAVETRLREIASSVDGPVAVWAAGTMAAGGKRLRPLLVVLAAGEVPPEPEALVRAGVAVELVHAATLVHDDVLDAAALRRGRETVWAAAGREAATATGDLLFARAFSELAANGSPESVRVLSGASSALAEGELLQRADAWDPSITEERYLRRCDLKTARLFEAACRLGELEGLPGGAPAAAELGAFGRRIGLAFQLLDDVLDVSGPPERTGKPRGTDLLDGTITLPFILARRADAGLAATEPRSITTAEQADGICAAIGRTGALEEVRSRATTLVADAKAQLPSGHPQRGALELVADGVVERYA